MKGGTTATWDHFPHGADVGIVGVGASLHEAFEQAGLALTAVVTDPKRVRPTEAVDVTCDAPDVELLLVEWLNALVYEMACRRMLFGRFEVRIDREHLTARAWGERVNRRRHQPAVEVKGATYTELGVIRDPDGTWHARCVVDV